MSHETYQDGGFSVREKTWHGLWPVLADYPTRDEAIRLADQDWRVEERKLLYHTGDQIDGFNHVVGWKGLIRSDNGTFLAAVKDSYEVIQNYVLWDLAEALLKTGSVQYETAGCLREGRETLICCRLKEAIRIPGDNSQTAIYLVLRQAHDGTAALTAVITAVRVVCANTLALALQGGENSGYSYKFRHTRKVMDRVEDARRVLGLTGEKVAAFEALASELAALPVSDAQAQTFVETFIPMPLESGAVTDRIYENIQSARSEVFRILDTSMTIPDEHRRTSYGLFCSGIEYLDHVRTFRSKETYFRRTLSDNGALKAKLVTLAKEVALA